MNNLLLGFNYNNWKRTCNLFLNPKIKRSLSMYLQDYPLTKLSSENIETIKSEDFFNEYIETGKVFFNSTVIWRTSNFITKNSGGFRDAQLLSPFLFLLLQAIGVEIQSRYVPLRRKNPKLIAYYSGDFSRNIVTYKSQYRGFCEVNTQLSKEFPYFIKTDISDYFSNINLDRLLAMINSRIDKENSSKFTPLQLKMIKETLYYCGNGKFPLVENSTCSSFLATIIYLDEIDDKMGSFIDDMTDIEDYRLVRYVDDLYIWIKPKDYQNQDKEDYNSEYNNIRFKYSSLLHSYGLTLNTNKTLFCKSEGISEQLKLNIYDEIIPEKENPISLNKEEAVDKIKNFMNDLINFNKKHNLTKEDLENIIDNNFRPKDAIDFTGEEVLRNIIFDKPEYLNDGNIISSINKLIIGRGISFIYLSPKLFTNMVLNTSRDQNRNKAVKTLLNEIFLQLRSGALNAYDINISLFYLLRTDFKHNDLKKKVIKEYDPKLFEYIAMYCVKDFFCSFCEENRKKSIYLQVINSDWKTYYLYANYLFEQERNNKIEAFAYYKTYFDRFTALISAYTTKTKLKVKDFYSTKNLDKVYKDLDLTKVYKDLERTNSYKIIKNANKLRNDNPFVHSSAQLIGRPSWEDDIDDCIKELQDLIKLRIESYD